MLAALRSNTKAFLWIVMVAFVGFIFAAWGRGIQRSQKGPERGLIGRVESVPIEYRQFNEAYRQNLQTYAQRTGSEVDEQTAEVIRNETWNQLVNEVLIEQEIERLGIDVPDQHVFDTLWNQPPQFAYESPAFQDEQGNFSFDLYHREIQLNPERWEGIAEMYRNTLKQQILTQEIQAGAFVTEAELWQEWVAQNATATVTYVVSDPRTVEREDIVPTEDEARAYFEANRRDYEIPERVVLDYVEFSREPTEEDEADVRNRLTDLAESVRQGEEFAELASIYSDGPSRAEGGDLGWFGRGQMVPEFDEVVFGMEEGEVSDPFETQFGYHIVYLEDTKTENGEEMVKARHILLEVAPSEETLVAVEQAVSEFSELAADDGLIEAATEMDYEVRTTDPFADGRFIPGIGTLRPAVKMAFDSDEDTVLGPYVTPDAYYVFEVREKLSSRVPSYDELAEDVAERGAQHPAVRDLTRERMAERARAIAEDVATAVRSGNTLEEAAALHGLDTRKAGPFTRRDAVPGVGQRNAFVGTSFGLRTGETSGVIEVQDPTRYYVLRLESRTAADQQTFEEQKDQLRQQLMQMERMDLFASWLEGLRDDADIEDFRDLYF
ncbi:MAG: hypothetical protein GF405_04075 [Candidatus Eisenbacteria bacterium]|nr:hypothetical protein [Candidatus Eisenbacteria bacterium]